MFATLDLIKAQPELARFQFRASNRWIGGSHNRSTIKELYAAGGEDTTRSEEFVIDAGEPAILLGSDTGANPAEHLLHALAACLTTSIVYVAAARKVELTSTPRAARTRPAREAFQIDAGEPAILLGTDTGANPAEYLLHALAACMTTSIVYVAAARKVELTSVESTLTGDMDVRGALGVDDEPRNGFERIGVSFRMTGDAPAEKLREVVERATEALGRLRHGHQRRARRRRGDHLLILVAGSWPKPSSGHEP